MKREKNNIISDILKDIPLNTSIKVLCEMHHLSILSDLGYRESKSWGPDEDELFNSLIKQSHILHEYIMEELENHGIDRNTKKPIKE